MKRKKEKVPQEKKLFSNKQLIIIAMVIIATIVLGFLVFAFLLQTQEVKFSSKAAIIDQLGKDLPNTEFNETVASLLESNGFNVSYHRSESVNVTFYKGLAKYNYGVIILRAHSALRKGETIVDFFTSEEYSEDKYVSEQDNGLLTIGKYSGENKSYFAVTPKFIENLEGSFPKSIIIAMGCNSLNETCTEMANAFINKGAKAYIGWTGLVNSSHTDSETIKLLRRLLDENQTITDAVSTVSPDWSFFPPSEMKFYPLSAGNLKISDLMAEAKAIATLQSTFCNFEKGFRIYITNVARFIKLS